MPLELYGLEVGYRATVQVMENAFAPETAGDRLCHMAGLHEGIEVAAFYGMQVSNSFIHTWDFAQVSGFSYQPASAVAPRVLRTMLSRPADAEDDRLLQPPVEPTDLLLKSALSGRG